MSDIPKNDKDATKKSAVTLAGTVEKIVPPIGFSEQGTAQIIVEGTEEPYREICVESTVQDKAGHSVRLKAGAQVKIKIEAESEATTPKKQTDGSL